MNLEAAIQNLLVSSSLIASYHLSQHLNIFLKIIRIQYSVDMISLPRLINELCKNDNKVGTDLLLTPSLRMNI